MNSPSPLPPRRLPLFILGVAALSAATSLATSSLPSAGYEASGATSGWFAAGGVATVVAAVLLGAPLGVLVDRARRRRTVLVVAALLAAAIVPSVAATGGLGLMTAPHVLVAVVAVSGVGALAPVPQEALLPAVAGRGFLVRANALLYVLPTVLLVAVTLPLSALDIDETGVLLAAGALALCAAAAFHGIEPAGRPVEEPPPGAGLWREALEGVRFTARHPVLRAITLYVVVSAAAGQFADEATRAARRVLVTDDSMTYAVVSFSTMISSLGGFVLGPLLAVLLHRRFGTFRLAAAAVLVSQPCLLLLALSGAPGGPVWHTLGGLVPLIGTIVAAIALVSHRQAITPGRLLGRVSGLLVALAMLGQTAGDVLSGPVSRLTGLAADTPAPPALLPGLALATALCLAAAVPLLRARHHPAEALEPAG
ncbi:MFS transporter [Nonomuraea candida]|uniref:MFS transporter n=1 Tax=Nonomuraea candida TaxID=359159 RepID=UPI0005BAEBBB|nr:MFS transporter [Nonomuraea candida]